MSTFHTGEQALQARAGARERLEALGPQLVRDHLPEAQREWFSKLPTLLLGVQDDLGQPWATMLQAPAGFISSPDARTLEVRARPDPSDPAAPWLLEGAAVGLLGLEPHTRRRHRTNGRVLGLHSEGFAVRVSQSFGNCPKYIHARRPQAAPASRPGPAQRLGPRLDARSIALLERADTVFIASANGPRPSDARCDGVDLSHRGGRPGFVRIQASPRGLRLTLPDYAGNSYFNTLGNLLVWPLAGLLVLDHADGSALQLAARAVIEFDPPPNGDPPATRRLLHLDVQSAWWRQAAWPLRWSAPEVAPQFALQPASVPGPQAGPPG